MSSDYIYWGTTRKTWKQSHNDKVQGWKQVFLLSKSWGLEVKAKEICPSKDWIIDLKWSEKIWNDLLVFLLRGSIPLSWLGSSRWGNFEVLWFSLLQYVSLARNLFIRTLRISCHKLLTDCIFFHYSRFLWSWFAPVWILGIFANLKYFKEIHSDLQNCINTFMNEFSLWELLKHKTERDDFF